MWCVWCVYVDVAREQTQTAQARLRFVSEPVEIDELTEAARPRTEREHEHTRAHRALRSSRTRARAHAFMIGVSSASRARAWAKRSHSLSSSSSSSRSSPSGQETHATHALASRICRSERACTRDVQTVEFHSTSGIAVVPCVRAQFEQKNQFGGPSARARAFACACI